MSCFNKDYFKCFRVCIFEIFHINILLSLYDIFSLSRHCYLFFPCMYPKYPNSASIKPGTYLCLILSDRVLTSFPLPLSPRRKVEIIRTSKTPPFPPLEKPSDISKPYQIYVKQRSCADVNSPNKRKCWTNSRSIITLSSQPSSMFFWDIYEIYNSSIKRK